MDPETLAVERYKAEQMLKSAAGWFWWIGGLSVVNSVIAGTGKEFTFTFGLGISQLGDALIAQKSPILYLIGFFMSYGFAFLFFFLAWLARHTPVALPIGMVVYALDALVFLVAQDWFGLGFHVFALFLIQTGYVAYKRAVALLATATPGESQTLATSTENTGAVS